jgi:hypothetical protein
MNPSFLIWKVGITLFPHLVNKVRAIQDVSKMGSLLKETELVFSPRGYAMLVGIALCIWGYSDLHDGPGSL